MLDVRTKSANLKVCWKERSGYTALIVYRLIMVKILAGSVAGQNDDRMKAAYTSYRLHPARSRYVVIFTTL